MTKFSQHLQTPQFILHHLTLRFLFSFSFMILHACSPNASLSTMDEESQYGGMNVTRVMSNGMTQEVNTPEGPRIQESDRSTPTDEVDTQDMISSPFLLVGKGADEFVEIEDGEVSTLHRGCQGAQHLWVSLRLPMHEPDAYGLELQLVDEANTLLAPPFTLQEEEWLSYNVVGQSQAGSEIIGLTLVIFDPMVVVGKEALVKTKVFIGDEVLKNHVWVEVQWGADAC